MKKSLQLKSKVESKLFYLNSFELFRLTLYIVSMSATAILLDNWLLVVVFILPAIVLLIVSILDELKIRPFIKELITRDDLHIHYSWFKDFGNYIVVTSPNDNTQMQHRLTWAENRYLSKRPKYTNFGFKINEDKE